MAKITHLLSSATRRILLIQGNSVQRLRYLTSTVMSPNQMSCDSIPAEVRFASFRPYSYSSATISFSPTVPFCRALLTDTANKRLRIPVQNTANHPRPGPTLLYCCLINPFNQGLRQSDTYHYLIFLVHVTSFHSSGNDPSLARFVNLHTSCIRIAQGKGICCVVYFFSCRNLPTL